MAGITICFVRMRRSGGMDDDGEAVPPKNKVQAPIGKSKCEEKIICLYPPHLKFQWLKDMAAKTNATGPFSVFSLYIKNRKANLKLTFLKSIGK